MGYQPFTFKPGIDVEESMLLNSSGWSQSQCIRFFEGLPQKIGGWAHLNNTKLIGTCRGLHAWADLTGVPYVAAGTEQRLAVFAGGLVYDITPLRKTTNPAVNFSTVINTFAVTIHDAAHGALVTDWINIVIPVSIGGIVLWGLYQIASIVDNNNYTITAATKATATVNNAGAVPTFTTTNLSANVTVTLNNHGFVAGNTFFVEVALTIATIVITAQGYNITAVGSANQFTIVPAGAANANAGPTAENGGNARIQYLIHTGLVTGDYQAGGYGVGNYGAGVYGAAGANNFFSPATQWFLDNFGQVLIGNRTNSPLYVWTPPPATFPAFSDAQSVDTANFPSAQAPPQNVAMSFVSAPQQMVVALGVDDAINHVFDPNLVRWCDVGDYTQWLASQTNQAGSYRIPTGSGLRGGISAPAFNALWTDIDMWLMSYLGGVGSLGAQLVWGFTKIATACDLLANRGAGVYENEVFWLSSNGFFHYGGGRVEIIPCTVWDKLWGNLNRAQIAKANCQVNSWFQEVSWAFPSAAGNGEVDALITFNIRENNWTYDTNPSVRARTAWIDDNVYGAPIGTDTSGYLQQHENGYDNDGMPMTSSVRSGWFAASEGTLSMMLERLSADLIASGESATVLITVYAQDYPTGPVRTYGPFSWNPTTGPGEQIVRARGRFMSIQFASTAPGVFWRLGKTRGYMKPAGRMP